MRGDCPSFALQVFEAALREHPATSFQVRKPLAILSVGRPLEPIPGGWLARAVVTTLYIGKAT